MGQWDSGLPGVRITQPLELVSRPGLIARLLRCDLPLPQVLAQLELREPPERGSSFFLAGEGARDVLSRFQAGAIDNATVRLWASAVRELPDLVIEPPMRKTILKVLDELVSADGQTDEAMVIVVRGLKAVDECRSQVRIEFPSLRFQIMSSLTAFASRERQKHWGVAQGASYEDLDLNLHFLYDDNEILSHPARYVEECIYPNEVAVFREFDRVLDWTLDDAIDDTAALGDPRWDAVVAAAGTVVAVMNRNDEAHS